MAVVIAVGRYRVILYCRIVERCYIKQSAPFWAVDPGRGVFVNALNISFLRCVPIGRDTSLEACCADL